MDRRTDGEVFAASLLDAQEFGAIYERYFEQIYRYVARRIGGEAAEDLAAEVFVRAFLLRGRFDRAAPSARPWLYGFAANIVRDHLRGQRRRARAYVRAFEPPPGSADIAEAEERSNAAILVPELNRALAALSATDRETFLLMVLGELSYEEIASALGIPIGTVRSRIARARTRMRRLMPGHGPPGDGETP